MAPRIVRFADGSIDRGNCAPAAPQASTLIMPNWTSAGSYSAFMGSCFIVLPRPKPLTPRFPARHLCDRLANAAERSGRGPGGRRQVA
jgi:hypothetical protein